MPTSRDGSFSAVAMSASLRLEVLVARIASGFAATSSFAKRERFASRFSKIASMITSARAAQPALKQLPGALHRRRDALWRGVLQRDREPAHGAERRDVAAHHAGADDVHMARREVRRLAERLQALLQEEDADQVRRRRVREQGLDRGRRIAGGPERVAVVLLPQLENRVRRRVVLAFSLSSDFPAGLRDNKASEGSGKHHRFPEGEAFSLW